MEVTSENVPVGQAALIAKLGLRVPLPAVTSVVGPGVRRTVIEDGRTVEKYTAGYMPEATTAGHLRFALRYEPLELGVLSAAFKTAEVALDIEAWARAEPTGAYAR